MIECSWDSQLCVNDSVLCSLVQQSGAMVDALPMPSPRRDRRSRVNPM